MTDFFSDADADYTGVEVREFNQDDYRLTAGKHRVQVSKAETVEKKDGSTAFIIEFSDKDGKTYTHWFNAIEEGDDQKFPGKGEVSLKEIKMAERVRILEQLGISREQIPSMKGDDVVGREGFLEIYKKANYLKYGKFAPLSSGLAKSTPVDDNFVQPDKVSVGSGDAKAFGI